MGLQDEVKRQIKAKESADRKEKEESARQALEDLPRAVATVARVLGGTVDRYGVKYETGVSGFPERHYLVVVVEHIDVMKREMDLRIVR